MLEISRENLYLGGRHTSGVYEQNLQRLCAFHPTRSHGVPCIFLTALHSSAAFDVRHSHREKLLHSWKLPRNKNSYATP